MKKTLFLITLMGFVSTPAIFAGNTSGCGLGSVIWSGSSGFFANLSAYSTNGSSASQYFGITSGTSGCSSSDVVMNEHENSVFVADNFEVLERNTSRGSGEYLSTYAVLMGCDSESAIKAFSSTIRKNYDHIFAENDPDKVVTKTQALIAANQEKLGCR